MKGFWEGKCYVFDARKQVAFSEDSADIGECANCGAATSHQENCTDASCNLQFVVCDSCAGKAEVKCDRHAVVVAV